MIFLKLAVRGTLAIAMTGSLASFANAQEASWKAGRMFVPASLSQSGKPCMSEAGGKCVAELKPGKHPVVLFMHGCGGPRQPNAFFAQGAIIVAPNSFAKGEKCNENDANAILGLLKQRGQDVAFASKQLREAAYIDGSKMILAGYSQGGQLAAVYPGNEFKARVMIAWTCNHKNPNMTGVRGSGPALAVLGTNDEYFKKVGITGNCDAAVATRGGPSKSVLIKGGTHEILDHAETKAAVAAFLPEVLK